MCNGVGIGPGLKLDGLEFCLEKLRPKVLEIQRSCLKTNPIPSKTKKSFTIKTKGLF